MSLGIENGVDVILRDGLESRKFELQLTGARMPIFHIFLKQLRCASGTLALLAFVLLFFLLSLASPQAQQNGGAVSNGNGNHGRQFGVPGDGGAVSNGNDNHGRQFGTPGEGSGLLPGETLGERVAIPITVTASSGSPICPSFSFSQIPRSPNLFVGKLKTSTDQGVCAGHVTLALFSIDWDTHVMTLLHPLMEVPVSSGPSIIADAYDPYVAEFGNEDWVAFECGGPHIPGTSSCVAPLVGKADHIDTSRLSIPIVGLDNDPKSPWIYSASTPKLLAFKGRLYLYWSAIQVDKAPPHRWNSVETRSAEMEIEKGSNGARQVWAKGRPGRPMPSHAPGYNVTVMSPSKDDPYRNTSVDTEGLYVLGNHIIVLSSVGGTGPDGNASCTKPLDKSPGCFRLEITRTSNPLADDSFNEQVLVSPTLPANAVEYPRIVKSPDGQTYLMVNTHPVQVAAAPASGKTLATGYLLIPFPVEALRFGSKDNK